MSINVLIVEDEFIVANDLRLVLEHAGYNVIGIDASAKEVEERLQKHKPDIALLDIRLKGKLSGIDLGRKLRTESIAFIYLSANSSQQILEEAKTTEPYGFLVKPFREKDLLVMMDIAWYRHKHILELKLRQEHLLQKQTEEISKETSGFEQRLLKTARVIQHHIPFDLIMSGTRPVKASQFNDAGYLRTGFDEYQLIGEKELVTITGLKKMDLSSLAEQMHAYADAIIYPDGLTTQKPGVNPLQKVLLDSFNLQSYIAFPIALGNGLSVHYFFFSRQRDIYTNAHIALLNRLRTCLARLADQTASTETSSPKTLSQPGSVSKQNTIMPDLPVIEGIVGNHFLLLSSLDLVAQVAPYNTSVLILGESGTGKEKIAQSIHSLSPRKNGPFIKVNCAAIPLNLIESELFGHEKGAFTGALEKRKGRFELAQEGTIFLDEIGELPREMQVKLLRVLQEKEIEPVGGGVPVKLNVRIVAATNRNLEKEVANGNFRLDLYYRLNVFPITLPPLRERKSDIETVALFFAKKFCREFKKPFTGIAASMMEQMCAYSWPGNIRELENVMEQSVVLNNGESELELKRILVATTESAGNEIIKTLEDIKLVQRETEREYIISILKKTKGKIRGINGAAELLNLKPTTLEAKVAKLNIKKIDFKDAIGNS